AEQVAAVVGRINRPDHAQHGYPRTHESDRDGVAPIAALHRRGPIVRVDDPRAVFARLLLDGAGLLTNKTQTRVRGEEHVTNRHLRVDVGRAFADFATRTARPGALRQQDVA